MAVAVMILVMVLPLLGVLGLTRLGKPSPRTVENGGGTGAAPGAVENGGGGRGAEASGLPDADGEHPPEPMGEAQEDTGGQSD